MSVHVHPKRVVAIFFMVLLLCFGPAGCVGRLQTAARDGDINTVRDIINSDVDVNEKTHAGMTALHHAAWNGRTAVVSLLIEKGANVNETNDFGKTALYFAKKENHTDVVELLESAERAGLARERQLLQSAARDQTAKPSPTQQPFQSALAETSSQPIDSDKIAKLKDSQPCKMKEPAWIYTGTKCTADVADGEGTASHENGVLTFKGQIKGGTRVKGIIYHSEIPLYDGPIVDGRPDGVGVCFHEGEPEECKFYNGKRIDAIFKQRIEFAKQREEMQQVKKDVENLKASSSTTSASSEPDAFTDTLKKEAGKRLAAEIFNRLF